jgi:hypothetical protein
MSLSKGYLDRLHAEAIIGAIEAFTSSRTKKVKVLPVRLGLL